MTFIPLLDRDKNSIAGMNRFTCSKCDEELVNGLCITNGCDAE